MELGPAVPTTAPPARRGAACQGRPGLYCYACDWQQSNEDRAAERPCRSCNSTVFYEQRRPPALWDDELPETPASTGGLAYLARDLRDGRTPRCA